MINDFLNRLYLEEEAVYKLLIKSPIMTDLVAIQQLISSRGGKPKFALSVGNHNPSFFTSADISETIAENNIRTVLSSEYDSKWSWEKKTKYAFKKLGGKSTPKGIIDMLITLDGIGENNKDGKERISSNVYNTISKLCRFQNALIKDPINKGFYTLIDEEAFI